MFAGCEAGACIHVLLYANVISTCVATSDYVVAGPMPFLPRTRDLLNLFNPIGAFYRLVFLRSGYLFFSCFRATNCFNFFLHIFISTMRECVCEMMESCSFYFYLFRSFPFPAKSLGVSLSISFPLFNFIHKFESENLQAY